MTAHPIDTEALRFTAEATVKEFGPAAWPDIPSSDLVSLLDALATAEHRATRAESERDEWREVALQERGAALDALEQIKVRDARIKAVEDVLNRWQIDGYDSLLRRIRCALDGER